MLSVSVICYANVAIVPNDPSSEVVVNDPPKSSCFGVPIAATITVYSYRIICWRNPGDQFLSFSYCCSIVRVVDFQTHSSNFVVKMEAKCSPIFLSEFAIAKTVSKGLDMVGVARTYT